MPYKDPEKRKAYHKKYSAKWNKQNKDKLSTAYKKYYHGSMTEEQKKKKRIVSLLWSKDKFVELKKLVLLKYSDNKLICNCCGESIYEFLTIDHVNGGGGQERKKRSAINFLRFLLREPLDLTKYQVLCYNCNCFNKNKKEIICPHKRKELL
jgi:hypothetical protein